MKVAKNQVLVVKKEKLLQTSIMGFDLTKTLKKNSQIKLNKTQSMMTNCFHDTSLIH